MHRSISFSFLPRAMAVFLLAGVACSKNNTSTSSTRVPATVTSPITPPVRGTASPAASTLTLHIGTPNKGDGILYDTNTLQAPPNTEVTVVYTNDTAITHNWHLFNGKDASAPMIAQTVLKAGPNSVESVSFKTPTQSGSYFFQCDVHPTQMTGHLVVK